MNSYQFLKFLQEEKVRAALEIPEDLGPIDGSLDTGSRLSRSSSFHSLPEYVIDEQGNVRPGIIPTTSSAAVRYEIFKKKLKKII